MASKTPVRGTVGDDLTGGKKGRSPSKPPSLTGAGPVSPVAAQAAAPAASPAVAVATASPAKKTPKSAADPLYCGIPAALFGVIVKALGGREALEGKTTRQVVSGCRELLDQARSSALSPATHFVVHAYDAPFLDLVDGITEWDAADEEREGGHRFYWLDFIACPPSKTPAREVAKGVRAVMGTVKRALVSFHVPVEGDLPMQARAWPTYEIFTAMVVGVPLEVIMPSELEEVVVPQLVKDFKGASEAWAPPVEFEGKALASRGSDKIGLLRALLLDFPALEEEAAAAKAAGAAGPLTPGGYPREPPLSCTVAPEIAAAVKYIDGRVTDLAIRLGHLDAVVTGFWCDWLGAMGQRALDILPQSLKYTGPLALQLAQFLHKRGDTASAVVAARACLEYRRESLGVAHAGTLAAMGVLGQLLETQERWLEAEALLGDAVAGLSSVLGEAHPEALTLAISLASVQCHGAPAARAAGLELLGETAELAEEHLGATHALTLQAKQELGRCLRREGEAEAAVTVLREVLGGRAAVLGEGHPDAAATLCELGLASLDAGNAAEGMSSVAEAVQQALDAFLETPVPAAARQMLCGYGAALGAEGATADALPVLEFASYLHNRDLGPTHPASVAAAFALVSCHLTMGNAAGASTVCQQTYAALVASVEGASPSSPVSSRSVAGLLAKPLPSHTAALRIYTIAARLLCAEGAGEEAEALYLRVLNGHLDALISPLLDDMEGFSQQCSDLDRVEAMCSLARDYGKLLMGREAHDAAGQYLATAAAGHQALRGNAHLESIASLEAWVVQLCRVGDITTAANAMRDCCAGSRELLGAQHPQTLRRIGLLQSVNELVASAAASMANDGRGRSTGPAVGGYSASGSGGVTALLGKAARAGAARARKIGRGLRALLRGLKRRVLGEPLKGGGADASLIDVVTVNRPRLQLASSAGSTPMSSSGSANSSTSSLNLARGLDSFSPNSRRGLASSSPSTRANPVMRTNPLTTGRGQPPRR